MSLKLEWEIEGEKQLSRRLRGISSTVGNLKKPFGDAAKDLRDTYKNDVFRTKGAVIDEKWKRLSPKTVAAKARKGYPLDPLIATSKMQHSFLYKAFRDHAVIWNVADYFKYHQSNKGSRRHLPRRVMMKLAERQRQMVVRTINTFLKKEINKK